MLPFVRLIYQCRCRNRSTFVVALTPPNFYVAIHFLVLLLLLVLILLRVLVLNLVPILRLLKFVPVTHTDSFARIVSLLHPSARFIPPSFSFLRTVRPVSCSHPIPLACPPPTLPGSPESGWRAKATQWRFRHQPQNSGTPAGAQK